MFFRSRTPSSAASQWPLAAGTTLSKSNKPLPLLSSLAGWLDGKLAWQRGLILGVLCWSMSVWKWPGTVVPPISSLLLSWPWDRIASVNNFTLQRSLDTEGMWSTGKLCPDRKESFYKLPVFICKILFIYFYRNDKAPAKEWQKTVEVCAVNDTRHIPHTSTYLWHPSMFQNNNKQHAVTGVPNYLLISL